MLRQSDGVVIRIPVSPRDDFLAAFAPTAGGADHAGQSGAALWIL